MREVKQGIFVVINTDKLFSVGCTTVDEHIGIELELDSGSSPIALGVLTAVFLKNNDLGVWKPTLAFWKPSHRIRLC